VLPFGFVNGFTCQQHIITPIIIDMSRSTSALGADSDGTVTARNRAASTPLDDVSKAIIEQLQQDGRRPYATIAAAVGLSEAAVRQRVSRLIGSGVVQIVAVTDPMQVGFSRQAMIGIKAEGNLEPVVAALTAMDEVDYVVITAGSFDILAEVVCEDDDHLLSLLNHRIRTIEGIASTESFMYLKLSKQTYTWGTR
jgi:Lrp/AsnC family transcriptional regulator for asnA, asnC and gidA